MHSAAGSREMEAALEEARVWLREHPGDDRVAAGMQRLEEREERLRDPENAVGWRGVVAVIALFSVSALAIFGALYALTGRWTISIFAGVVLALEITWWTWDMVMAYIEDRLRNRSGE
jgi:hypothetical protein